MTDAYDAERDETPQNSENTGDVPPTYPEEAKWALERDRYREGLREVADRLQAAEDRRRAAGDVWRDVAQAEYVRRITEAERFARSLTTSQPQPEGDEK